MTQYYTVIKSNELIRNTINTYSEIELKVSLYIISRISKGKSDLIIFILLKDITSALNIESSGKNYRNIRNALTSLKKKDIILYNNSDTNPIKFIESLETSDNLSYKIQLSDFLNEHLLNQEENFTSFSFENITNLKSKYAIVLYEYFKSYQHMKLTKSKYTLTIKIDTLKNKLNISNVKSYNKLSDFKRKVLDNAIIQINYNTDLFIELDIQRKNKSSTYFNINIKSRKNDNIPFIRDMIYSEIEITSDINYKTNYERYTKKAIEIIRELLTTEKELLEQYHITHTERLRLEKLLEEIENSRKNKEKLYYVKAKEDIKAKNKSIRESKKSDLLISKLQKELPF
ncbi:MAG: RepB family plasmid replication initiator protein [Firmicutes bacterium]|jgi:plasmid replication initiation protein|nr:RepB family plasmid replication initiator protein [Bacillota bacterium]